MRANPRHLRTLSLLLALAAFTFTWLRMDSRPPYESVQLYGNLSVLCIIASILSLLTYYLWPLPSLRSSSASPSPARTAARLFCLAAYLCFTTGILLIVVSFSSRPDKSIPLGELGLVALLIGLVTAIAAKLGDIQADRQARTRTRAPHDQDHDQDPDPRT